MNTLDIILIVVALVAFAFGYFKGIISQLSLGVGVIVGLLLAMAHYPAGAQIVKEYINVEDFLCTIIAFAAILLCSVLALKLLGFIISGLLKVIHLEFINNILGAVFATIIGLLFFVDAVNITCEFFPENQYTGKTSQKNSMLYKHTKIFTSQIVEEVEKKI